MVSGKTSTFQLTKHCNNYFRTTGAHGIIYSTMDIEEMQQLLVYSDVNLLGAKNRK
jgi:hypothetical protein